MIMTRKFKTLDVRPLLAKGMEPFTTIRERIDQLGPDEGLSVIAPFLPSPLIEKLTAERFCVRVEHQIGFWITHFWRDETATGE
jgi:hypothetical protein